MTSDEGREQSRTVAFFRRVLDELGLVSLYKSTSDVKLLCLQRFVRLFAYGASTLVLVAFLRELHISQARIGLFMTLTLAGDVCISFILALFADRLGRRAVIFTGAVLMCGSGLVFALVDNYWVLLLAAVLGVISPSGNEIGPFRAVEESIIAHVTDPTHRSDVYAWYSLSGNGGTAFGMMVCGWVILALRRSHDTTLEVYRYIFYGYAALGLAKAAMVLMLSSAVEAEDRPRNTTSIPGNSNGETQPLLSNEAQADSRLASKKKPWLPQLSKESRTTVFTLCTLFMLDAFASGLAPLSWLTYFFKSRYNLPEEKLGSIFFTTGIIAAASTIVASSLAKRFGNVKTMAFTHLPSSVFLAAIPIPNEVHWSIMFLVLRSCTQSMDVAPRSAFLAMILPAGERTAIMGLINICKTIAQTCGPLATGILAESNYFWVSFVCAGSLKVCYDIGLLLTFKSHERKHEREQQQQQQQQRSEREGEGEE